MWDKISQRKIEILLLIGGIIFIGLGATIEEWSKIPRHWELETRTGAVALGTALAIAGFLALTVDRKLKEDIAQDAFRSVMGWVSPNRLQSELESVYRQPLFAVEHRMTVTLRETPNDLMRMNIDVERTFRNESLRSQEFRPSLGVRDWLQPGRESAITEIAASFNGKRYNETEKFEHPDEEATDQRGERLSKPIMLDREDEVTVFFKYYEDKLINDVHWEVFLIPTHNPTVTVIHPASVAAYVQFSSEAEKDRERESRIGDEVTSQWTLKGVMLPAQAIIIRWWPIPASQLKTET